MKSKAGREAKDKYLQLSRLPKNHLGVAQRLFDQLPDCPVLRDVPKEQLFQVFLPEGKCTHGNLTNNTAEVFNFMALPTRKESSLFRSMLRTEELLRRRQQSLSEEYESARQAQTCGDSQAWKTHGFPPQVDAIQKKLGQAAASLLPATQSTQTPDTFLIQSDSSEGFRYV